MQKEEQIREGLKSSACAERAEVRKQLGGLSTGAADQILKGVAFQATLSRST
jgi:hypothetical protein